MKVGARQRQDPQELLPAWQGLRRSVPAFGPIRNDTEHRRMNALMESLLQVIGDDEKHELADFLDVVSTLVGEYEDKHHPEPTPLEPKELLRFLMEQHNVKQVDLKNELGSQSVVSEILSGKREINARQAKALSKRFGISAAVFI